MKKKISVLLLVFLSAVMLSGCGEVDSTFRSANEANEASIRELLQNREFPVLQDALDWDNVAMRAEFMNVKGRIGYLYVFSSNGVLLLEVPVLNKLTSLNTYITPMEEVKGSSESYYTVEASDLDGTYGQNVDGVFWFDPDGEYQEMPVSGAILIYSSKRMSIDTPPLLQEFYGGNN